jgi:FtsZ-interacting cell division protein ZipA
MPTPDDEGGDEGMAWVILAVVIVLAVIVIGWLWARMRRTSRLRSRFGSEYDRAVDASSGDSSQAEAELRERERRHDQLYIRPLSADAQAGYSRRWREVQARFVDQPATAVGEADALIGQAMQERGYPVEDFEQRAADLSVEHPHVVDDYRAAHAIAVANSGQQASTEDLRQAMVHYRALFEQLIGVEEPAPKEARH